MEFLQIDKSKLAIFLSPYPSGIFTGKWKDRGFLCVMTPEEAQQVDKRKADASPNCMWFCHFPQTLVDKLVLYVSISGEFPYEETISDEPNGNDAVILVRR